MKRRSEWPTEIIGQTFASLRVVDKSENIGPVKYAACVCACGTETSVRVACLLNGQTKSCGCRRRTLLKPRYTHRMTRTPEYRTWTSMRDRCKNPRSREYANYGGRGIAVCAAWQSFEQFFADMGLRPSDKHSLDRIDNSGNYEPTNCRWATTKQQHANKRTVRLITYAGESLPLMEWSRRLGIQQGTLHRRVMLLKWPIEKAFTIPTNWYHQRSRLTAK